MYRRAALRRLRRRLHRIPALPPRELLTTLHALGVLVTVELLIRWLSLPRLVALLGVRLDMASPAAVPITPVELSRRAEARIRGAERVAAVWPFCEGPCLRRSLVTAHLLRSEHASVRLGVAGSGPELRAHAWVEIDGRPLEDVSEFAVLRNGTNAHVA
jgi:hypothetical protein